MSPALDPELIEHTAVYLRISLDKDGDQEAVERQAEDAQALARMRGWEVVDTYCDNSMSASKRSVVRPEYERMLADYKAGRFQAIICYDLDRLTRQPRQLEDWIEEAEKNGLVILTLNGEADLSNDNGRMFARIKAAVARGEVERKGARQKRANQQAAEKGRWGFTNRPFGYLREGHRIVQVEAEAAELRAAYQAYIEGASFNSISKDWNERGVRTSKGGEWVPSRVMKLLENPRNAGIVVYDGKRVEVAEGAILQWEPIIDKRTWATFSTVRDERRRGMDWTTSNKHLLSGMAACAVCQGKLYAHPDSVRPGKNGRTDKRMTYTCQKAHVSISAAALDEHVEGQALARMTDPRILRALRRTPDTSALEEQLAEATTLLSEQLDLTRTARLPQTRRTAREEVERIEKRIESLSTQLSRLRAESPLLNLVAEGTRRDIAKGWVTMSLAGKRRTLTDLGIIVSVNKGKPGRPRKGAMGTVPNLDRVAVEWEMA